MDFDWVWLVVGIGLVLLAALAATGMIMARMMGEKPSRLTVAVLVVSVFSLAYMATRAWDWWGGA